MSGRAGTPASISSAAAIPDAPPASSNPLAQTLWSRRIPVKITHLSCPNRAPFVANIPRFSYLAHLLPRLTAYFKAPCSSFTYEGIDLRALCTGLLIDLYAPELPWELQVTDGGGWDLADTFLNSVKEADFIRNGNAKKIMGMSKEDTSGLWQAVVDNDYAAFARINSMLLRTGTPLKHVPIRIYIPTTPPSRNGEPVEPGSFRVMQALIPPRNPNRTPQTLGPALRSLLPSLFPSSRDPVLANVHLHGAPVPFRAPLEELMRDVAYPDGWLCFVIMLL